jgi:hypothetical protein
MKNIRTYLLVLCALTLFAGCFLLNGYETSHAELLTPKVEVVNKPDKPLPVAVQGTTNVAGTVSVSNFPGFPVNQPVTVTNLPATQPVAVTNLPAVQEIAAAGTPITLRQSLGLSGPINSVEHVVLFDDATGNHQLNGRLAIGSLSIAAASSGNAGEIDFNFFATNCSGNGYGEVRSVVMQTGTTMHLDLPIPQMVPSGGSFSPFCIEADVLNGNHAANIDVSLVGSAR